MSAPLPDSTPPRVRDAVAEAKVRLEALYGARLARVVLYGSYARGDARPGSDVDLLVVLRGPYQAYAETKRITETLFDLELAYDLSLAAQPFSEAEVADTERPLMWNVEREGLAV